VTGSAARGVLGRFLVLTTIRWLPIGILLPLMVLLPLDRGLSLTEIGTAYAVQGFVVLALELPTGGFADSLGRRPVLLLSAVTAAASYLLFLVTDSFWSLVAFAVLQGVHRALDSGPLEAWYVDAVHEIDPHARIESGMSAQGAALGLGVATGATLSGVLVALDPVSGVDALVLPVLVALGLQMLGTVAVAVLMDEHRPARASGVLASVRETPRAIADGIGLLRNSHVLLALLCVELFWGFGMVTFESLLPVRLSEVGGGTEAAAAITGPAVSAAWAASAVGAATAAWLARGVGTSATAALLRVLQGACVVLLGILGGVAGILLAYFACYVVHGSSNALHSTLLHRQVRSDTRATVVSMNSMFAQPAGSIGLIVLTGVADGVSTSVAMVVGGIVLAIAAPLYLPAWRQERQSHRALRLRNAATGHRPEAT
jgi:MFS family permease